MNGRLPDLKHTASGKVIQAVFSLTHIYFKTEKYSEAAASCARGMRSAAEWEDEIYMTKFRLIKELYQGEGGQDSLKEYFDILESKELLADTEELLQDAAHFFHKRENYKAASYFFRQACRRAKKAAK